MRVLIVLRHFKGRCMSQHDKALSRKDDDFFPWAMMGKLHLPPMQMHAMTTVLPGHAFLCNQQSFLVSIQLTIHHCHKHRDIVSAQSLTARRAGCVGSCCRHTPTSAGREGWPCLCW